MKIGVADTVMSCVYHTVPHHSQASIFSQPNLESDPKNKYGCFFMDWLIGCITL